MKSITLVSKIIRAVDTAGASGDGASLAVLYADAVAAVNQRLEVVEGQLNAGQWGQVFLLLETAPRLMDEVSLLGFQQLAQWTELCAQMGWRMPAAIDYDCQERIQARCRAGDALEPILKLYRKAMRTNDTPLAVQSLRQLIHLDASGQNWHNALQGMELKLQEAQYQAFLKAKNEGDDERTLSVVQAFFAEPWGSEPPKTMRQAMEDFQSTHLLKQRQAELDEDVVLLKLLFDDWNRKKVASLLSNIANLQAAGACLSESDNTLLEACQERVTAELDEEKRQQRIRVLNEELYAAVQQEDEPLIRKLLASPEYLEDAPDEDLLMQARLVLSHKEAERKKKVRSIVFSILFAAGATTGLAYWWLQQVQFNKACEQEVARLERIAQDVEPIKNLEVALKDLEISNPEVAKDSRIVEFHSRLANLKQKHEAYLSELEQLFAQCPKEGETWNGDVEVYEATLEKLNQLIGEKDLTNRVRLSQLELAFNNHKTALRKMKAEAAEIALKPLLEEGEALLTVFNKRFSSEKDVERHQKWQADIAEWKRVYAQYSPSSDAALDSLELKFVTPMKNSQAGRELYEKLTNAKTWDNLLEMRKNLIAYYPNYMGVSALSALPYEEADVKKLLEKNIPWIAKLQALAPARMMSNETFNTYKKDEVLVLEEFSAYVGLYSIYATNMPYNGVMRNLVCYVAQGKPSFQKPSYENKTIIKGDLWDVRTGESSSEKRLANILGRSYQYKKMATSEEVEKVLSEVKSAYMTPKKFEQLLTVYIQKHLTEIKATPANQVVWDLQYYSAYRRVKMVSLYLSWMNDVVPFSEGSPLSDVLKRCERLAEDVSISGVDDEMSWVCYDKDVVKKREKACYDFLLQLAKQNIFEDHRKWVEGYRNIATLSHLSFEFAGQLSFVPDRTEALIPRLLPSTLLDAPLYVLRKVDGELKLCEALIPNKKTGNWLKSHRLNGKFYLAEPLFTISLSGKPVDFREEMTAVFKRAGKFAPEELRKNTLLVE